MNNHTIAKNILIHKQIGEVVSEFNRENIDFILLKGAALIEIFPDYAFSRDMEDIDILVKKRSFLMAKHILINIGYSCAIEDPGAFFKQGFPARIDLCDGLWYLDRSENILLFKEAKIFFDISVLSPEDFYIHVFAHAFLHHARRERAWLDDLALLSERWAETIDKKTLSLKIKKYGFDRVSSNPFYNWFLDKEIPLKGHIFRFFFLPVRKKFLYINDLL
ncbi:MAG: nucleotidyltransferase family protein, partial [Elusimicrobia bacterium]|nr:nucleotidyltransferase family protein [Elusimicrobiota bacterium]